jgi:hypothetical protein
MEFHLNILGGFWMSQVEIGLQSLTETFPGESLISWSSEPDCPPRTLMAWLCTATHWPGCDCGRSQDQEMPAHRPLGSIACNIARHA